MTNMIQMIKFEMNKRKMNSKGQAQNVVALVVVSIVIVIALMIWNVVTAGLGAAGNQQIGTGYGNLGSIAAFNTMNVGVNTLLPVYAIVVAAVIIIGILGFLQRSS